MPAKRDRRYKSRMTAQSDAERVSVRERALEMAQRGLNRRGGPVDKGPPDAQKRAAQQMQGPKKEARNEQGRRSWSLFRNSSGNERSGQMYRTIPAKGGVFHEYGGVGGKRVFVAKPETGGTHNRVMPRKTAGDSIDAQIRDLARQRATQNRPKARRRLFSRTG